VLAKFVPSLALWPHRTDSQRSTSLLPFEKYKLNRTALVGSRCSKKKGTTLRKKKKPSAALKALHAPHPGPRYQTDSGPDAKEPTAKGGGRRKRKERLTKRKAGSGKVRRGGWFGLMSIPKEPQIVVKCRLIPLVPVIICVDHTGVDVRIVKT